ncbi:MAG: hypothetical protein ACLS8R_04140 [Anaeromassilibacillus sp.]
MQRRAAPGWSPPSVGLLYRICWIIVSVPNFTCGPKILRGAAGKSAGQNALAAVLGILVAIPLVMVVDRC